MTNKDFMNESMDLKKLFLCLRKKLIWIIIAAITGALLCGAVYLMVRAAQMPVVYQARSQFYLQFIYDPSGEIEQYYNGYTWNDLLHADPVLDQVVLALKEQPESEKIFGGARTFAEYKKQLRANTFKGEILSDRRLLTVTFTTADREKTTLIQKSMETGLLNYAAANHEIISMELIRSDEPYLLVWEDNLARAMIGGAVLFLILALFSWWFYYILDDSLYTVADVEKRYPYPAAGILIKGENAGDYFAGPAPYFAETKENLAYLLKDKTRPVFLSVDEIPYPDAAKLRASGVVLLVPFGRRNGKKTDRCVSFLRNQDIEILGIIITEADKKFLESYYRQRDVSASDQ